MDVLPSELIILFKFCCQLWRVLKIVPFLHHSLEDLSQPKDIHSFTFSSVNLIHSGPVTAMPSYIYNFKESIMGLWHQLIGGSEARIMHKFSKKIRNNHASVYWDFPNTYKFQSSLILLWARSSYYMISEKYRKCYNIFCAKIKSIKTQNLVQGDSRDQAQLLHHLKDKWFFL